MVRGLIGVLLMLVVLTPGLNNSDWHRLFSFREAVASGRQRKEKRQREGSYCEKQ